MRLRTRAEEGFSLIMVAISLFLLLGAAAFAIDLSAIRLDRATDQRVTDAAAAAGALAVAAGDGVDGCEAALAYVALNTPQMSPLSTAGCSSFNAGCNPTFGSEYTQTSGRFTVTFVYPVPDGHPLMTPGAIGSPSQAIDPKDGTSCDRVGVEITSVTDASFARVLGFNAGPTTVHTVAKASIAGGGGTPINLLVLDRFGCEGFRLSGGGVVIVDAVLNPVTGVLEAGVAAADSLGNNPVCTAGTGGVVSISGNSATFRADGPTGCANQTGTHTQGTLTVGEGCGFIQTLAPGTPGCGGGGANAPACTPGAGGGNQPNPVATALPAALTRAPVDHRYNCKSDYTTVPASVSWATDPLTVANEQNIPPCSNLFTSNIQNWIASVGQSNTPLGYNRYGSPQSCSVGSLNFASGNWYVDCDTFSVTGTVTFGTVGSSTPTNVVFKGHVSVSSNGSGLIINNSLAVPGSAFFRGQGPVSSGSKGTLTKGGGANLTFMYTTVYMAKQTMVALAGNGSGALTWIAPNSGSFDDLSLWSDSTLAQNWSGNAGLTMEGVFFTPLATGIYQGNGGLAQVNAQWIADKLWLGGNGTLVVRPQYGRSVQPPAAPGTVLIR
jgi:hypothetical protein